MQNESTIDNSGPVNSGPPAMPKAGYKTTSGQFTALFTLAGILLSLLGFHHAPDKIENWVEAANTFVTTILPLLGLVPVLITYINSRGKIASNAIVSANTPTMTQVEGQLLTATLQPAPLFGMNFKDPHTYEKLIHLANEVGVPGAGQLDAIQQKVSAADLITDILGMFHKKTKNLSPQ